MSCRILVIEDNATNLELMSYLLRSYGYTSLQARDGEEGVESALREQPDLIICDIQLPRRDGYGVVRALKTDSRFRSIPMVAVTALAMVGDRDKVLAGGFNGYIAKPIQPETFMAQVEEFLRPEQKSGRSPSQSTGASTPPLALEQRLGAILVVDDRKENVQLLCSILQPFGYRVISTDQIEEALELARREQPDLILSDLHLREETGFGFWRSLQLDPSLSKIPFVLVSSSSPNREERAQAAEMKAKLLIRPIDSDRLLAEIESRLSIKKGVSDGDHSGS